MHFKVDEDLPEEVAILFRAVGHDAHTVGNQQLQGCPDEELWAVVQRENRCLVTADKGFGDPRRHTQTAHGGIVLFRLPRESRAGYVRLTEQLLAGYNLEEIRGTILVVTPQAIRVHRGP